MSNTEASTHRNCPLCGGTGHRAAFPFATRFNGRQFSYVGCAACSCVYVDPVPDAETFSRMYAKAQYHDAYYADADQTAYLQSARMLRDLLPEGARVLDYGCGTGAFLQALRTVGLAPFGVEFDHDAAQAASRRSQCEVQTVDAFWAGDASGFDAIHLGDVLEHLPDPGAVLRQLLARLRPGGVLFAEGPLEVNPSPVYWCATVFGWAKRLARPGFMASHPPTHLYRASGSQQLAFFRRVEPRLSLCHWELYETGWPYARGGRLQRAIAGAAVAFSGLRRSLFGNRFRGLFVFDTVRQHQPAAVGEPIEEVQRA
jgi:2-polyprenyl-3-methyl-5-hydroxy-6-metoxy-1,4-benzoquinol methylase